MKYAMVVPATFLRRPNRFVAVVELEGREETVHVKNTGRCRELLIPGVRVWLSAADNPLRRTAFDLIAVEKEREGRSPLLINMDSQAPNMVAAEWLPCSGWFSENARIHREVRYGNSRFDLYVEDGDRRVFIEVKGVTLEEAGVGWFPDAPTVRGTKHLRELAACVADGYEACLLFVVQMAEVDVVCPQDRTDPVFGTALRQAAADGVRVEAVGCTVNPDGMEISCELSVKLG